MPCFVFVTKGYVSYTVLQNHRKERFSSFPSPAGMSLTKLPLGRNNSVMTSLFPPRESLVVTSRLGTGNSRSFFLRCRLPKGGFAIQEHSPVVFSSFLNWVSLFSILQHHALFCVCHQRICLLIQCCGTVTKLLKGGLAIQEHSPSPLCQFFNGVSLLSILHHYALFCICHQRLCLLYSVAKP